MMLVGWAAFLGSWLMNILFYLVVILHVLIYLLIYFYKVHPSSVDYDKKRFREKLFIYVQGKKRLLWGYRDSKGAGMLWASACIHVKQFIF